MNLVLDTRWSPMMVTKNPPQPPGRQTVCCMIIDGNQSFTNVRNGIIATSADLNTIRLVCHSSETVG